jgi:hypothetical protein
MKGSLFGDRELMEALDLEQIHEEEIIKKDLHLDTVDNLESARTEKFNYENILSPTKENDDPVA